MTADGVDVAAVAQLLYEEFFDVGGPREPGHGAPADWLASEPLLAHQQLHDAVLEPEELACAVGRFALADDPRPAQGIAQRFQAPVGTPGVRMLRGLACPVSQRAMQSGTRCLSSPRAAGRRGGVPGCRTRSWISSPPPGRPAITVPWAVSNRSHGFAGDLEAGPDAEVVHRIARWLPVEVGRASDIEG